jgi:hypothetical protein
MWRQTLVNVVIERAPFAAGAMRAAYHMRDLSTPGDRAFVAKIAKVAGTPVAQYFDDVRMQTEAQKWASAFNAKGVPKKVQFIAASVMELVERPGRPLCGVERFVPGTYVKYNNNWDWSDDQRNTPQAFSHFTWEESKHALLICDIQGVADMYTDPQIHSTDMKGYGQGNLGMPGVKKFLEKHTCNSICRFLKLPACAGQKAADAGTVVNGAPAGGTLQAKRTHLAAAGGGAGGKGRGWSGGLADGVELRAERERLKRELNAQWEQQIAEMKAAAQAKVKARLEAERAKMQREHAVALQEQQRRLEAERERLEREKGAWLEQEERKLAHELDRRLEDQRVRQARPRPAPALPPPCPLSARATAVSPPPPAQRTGAG